MASTTEHERLQEARESNVPWRKWDPYLSERQCGSRPVYGGTEKFQSDPHWRDHLLFYEYFHGDNGAGLGVNHQTGWTGLVGTVIHLFGALDPQRALEVGKMAAFGRSPAPT
jgi:hypothetical protein